MTTNDTQTMLAHFYGRLQADKLRAKAYVENDRQLVPIDQYKVELTEHGVRVVDTTTGKTEYSNSIYTCANEATSIRNLVVFMVAKAMKKVFIARQSHNNDGNLGQRWTDFSNSSDVVPLKSADAVRYINSLKTETEKSLLGMSFGAKIIGSASLTLDHACADIDATGTALAATLNSTDSVRCSLSDQEQQRLADKFVDDLLEKRLAAKQEVKAAQTKVDEIRRNNRDKAGKPLADKFQALTGKPVETLTLAEAQKAHEDARRLFNALEWLSAELELVPDTMGTAGKLFYGLVRRF